MMGDIDDDVFFVCPTLSVTAWWEASRETDHPPEPNGAGPPSTCARHGTVLGTAPEVSVQLTPNCLPSADYSPGGGTLPVSAS